MSASNTYYQNRGVDTSWGRCSTSFLESVAKAQSKRRDLSRPTLGRKPQSNDKPSALVSPTMLPRNAFSLAADSFDDECPDSIYPLQLRRRPPETVSRVTGPILAEQENSKMTSLVDSLHVTSVACRCAHPFSRAAGRLRSVLWAQSVIVTSSRSGKTGGGTEKRHWHCWYGSTPR
ncbi:uncharacterized protein BDV17DRAFT_178883 [Aspergillus undulatus]|uniref:uncharacterized protein n=1 Tax=Aspergillus undulatus TaxID=1810928 RepID=UPI003CCCF9DC